MVERHKELRSIIHLAAQAGVRYSLENPYAYIDANVTGTLVMLEAARRIDDLTAITYASSSSVYGANRKQPFSSRRSGRSSGLALCRDKAQLRADGAYLHPSLSVCRRQGCGSSPSMAHGGARTWRLICSPARFSPASR